MGSTYVRVMSACPTDSSSTGRSSRLSGTCPSRPACDPPPRTLCSLELPHTWVQVVVPLASIAAVPGRLGMAAVLVRDRDPRGSPGTLVGGNLGAGIPAGGSPAEGAGPGADILERTDRCTVEAAQNSSLQ